MSLNDLEDVRDAEIRLAVVDERQKDGLARLWLKPGLHSHFLLDHLRNRRGRGVVECARLHCGHAEGLRRSGAGGERQRGCDAEAGQGSTPAGRCSSGWDSFGHGSSSPCWLAFLWPKALL